MDDGLKQRIIGAFVLVALMIIFVPIFFDKERITPLDRTTRIPLEPDIEPIEINKPVPVEDAKEMPEPKQVFIPDETRPQTLVEEDHGLTESGMPKSWVLQIASFREDNRATVLRDKLLADGFEAYVRKVETNKGLMARVYVGPKLDKNSLIRQKHKIDEKYKISAIILRHNL